MTTVKPSAITFAAITATPSPAARPVSVRANPLTNEGRSAVCTRRAYSVARMSPALSKGSDGRKRCWWGASTREYERYHDEEWGRPVRDERGLYERMVLEGFQSGL